MLILIGKGERTYEFAHVEREHCAKCGGERDFVLRLKYQYGHLYHLFGWVVSREYQLICPVCSHGWRLDARNARALIGRDPVPFHQRAGWLVLLLLAGLIAVATVAYHRRSAPPSPGDERPAVLASSPVRHASTSLGAPAPTAPGYVARRQASGRPAQCG